MTATSPVGRILRVLWPKTLASQLIMLILVAIVAAQAVSIWIFEDERRGALVELARNHLLARVSSVADLVEQSPPELQGQILKISSNRFLVFWLGQTPLAPEPGTSRIETKLQELLAEQLTGGTAANVHIYRSEERDQDAGGETGNARRPAPGWHRIPEHERPHSLRRIMKKPEDLSISVQMTDGRWLNVAAGFRPPRKSILPLLVQLGLMGLATVVIVGFAVRRVTRPLKELAVSAEKFGRGENGRPLTPSGPDEVRSLTLAFNDMQDRLSRFVKDRTRMLAAISHDLRTPITSLRIRAEFIEDDENREKMIETLEEMAAMTEATLRFTRDEAHAEEPQKADLGAILDSIAGDQQDMGHSCSVSVEDRILLSCRPVALKRALRNLIENGIRYGEAVKVTASRENGEAVIRIADKGPGIPEDRLKDVFEPFVRLEESRNEETGGIGLGLAITRSIIHAHGGTITLENGPEGGLTAEVRLPFGK